MLTTVTFCTADVQHSSHNMSCSRDLDLDKTAQKFQVCSIVLISHQFFLPSPKQLPSCTLVEMWSHFRPQSPWAQPARVQCWNSSVGKAGLGAVQSAEFLNRSTLYCCPHTANSWGLQVWLPRSHCALTRKDTLWGAGAKTARDKISS